MKSILRPFIFPIILFLIISCEDKSDEDYVPSLLTKETFHDLLLDAYNDSCTVCLKGILDQWNKSITAKSDIPDSIKDVYEVYKEFYSPWELTRTCESEFGDNIYDGISYYLIQNSIIYDFGLSEINSTYFTVHDFCPTISNNTIHTLYLTEDYREAINEFLGVDNRFYPSDLSGSGLTMNEIYNRYNFLSNYLHFFGGHWGNYWHIETHPEVLLISFNFDIDTARVSFRLGYQGGEATLIKSGVKWEIAEHHMTWIE